MYRGEAIKRASPPPSSVQRRCIKVSISFARASKAVTDDTALLLILAGNIEHIMQIVSGAVCNAIINIFPSAR